MDFSDRQLYAQEANIAQRPSIEEMDFSDRQRYAKEAVIAELPSIEEIPTTPGGPTPVFHSRSTDSKKRMVKQNRNLWLTLCCFIPTCGFCCGLCVNSD